MKPSILSKINPRVIGNITDLWNMAKDNGTLVELFNKLDGADASTAYHVLKEMSDQELKILAALIAQANIKFDRKGKEDVSA